MLSNILVTGGTSSLHNWITRLRVSILQSLLPPPSDPSEHSGAVPPFGTPEARGKETREWRRRGDEPYKALYGLAGKVVILNDPAPLSGDAQGAGASRGGSAPRWTTGLMSWVGGSLAG
jgi:actin-related protein 10